MKKIKTTKLIALIAAAGIFANCFSAMAVPAYADEWNDEMAVETVIEVSAEEEPEAVAEEIAEEAAETQDVAEETASEPEEESSVEEITEPAAEEEEEQAAASEEIEAGEEIAAEEAAAEETVAEETAAEETAAEETAAEEAAAEETAAEETTVSEEKEEKVLITEEDSEKKEAAKAEKTETEEPAEEEKEDDEIEMCRRQFKLNAGDGQKVTLDGIVPKASSAQAVDVCGTEGFEDSLVAMDITIMNDGEEYQPGEDNPVTVKITSKAIEEGMNLRVWHIRDDGTREEVTEFTVSGSTIRFEAAGFSVYEVTDEDGNPVTARAAYHFLNEDGSDAGIADQIIKDQEQLREVRAVEYENKVFLGWFVYENGSWGEQVVFDSAIQVLFGTERAVYGSSVVVPKDGDGLVEINVRPRYTTDFATIYFMKDTVSSYSDIRVVQQSIKVGFGEGESVLDYSIPEVTEISVLSANSGFEFVGWSESRPGKASAYYSDADNREMIDTLTIRKDKTYVLYPVFKKAHWMFFKTAGTGMGADYVSPVFVANQSLAATKKPADPSWRGFKFLYWTATPTFDEETGEMVRFEEGSEPEEFDFNQILTENITLYAFWESGYTTYTVIFWKQKVTDGKDELPENRTYEYAEQENREAKVGSILNPTPEDLEKEYTGFHHKTEQDAKDDIHTDSKDVKAASSGSSVLNVYYDRDVITMKFYNGTSAPAGGYDDPAYTASENGYIATEGTDGVQFAKVGGKYVRLEHQESSTTTIAWKDKSGNIYDESSIYTKSGWSYIAYNGNYKPGTTYYGYNSATGKYSTVTRSQSEIVTHIWLLNGEEYTGTRYVEDAAGACFSFKGLYGQSLESLGYSWPDGMWYYYNDENGTTGMSFLGSFVLPDGVRDEKGQEIRLFRNSSAATKIYFYLQNADGTYSENPSDTGNGTGGNFMFSEKYDGYTVSSYRRYYTNYRGTITYVDSSRQPARNSSGSFVSVATSNGYGTYYTLMVRYERRTYGISYYDSMDGQALTVHMKNGTTAPYQKNIRYGSEVDGYFPDASFTANAKQPGYTFNGRWYSDQGQTIQLFFHESGNPSLSAEEEALLWYYVDQSGEKIYNGQVPTEEQLSMEGRSYAKDEYEVLTSMPMRNLAVYAGFTHDWYWVKVDANGGELDPEMAYATYFWEQYGGIVEEYPISRDYVRDDSGNYYYHYDEFNTADPEGAQPAQRKAYYTTDASKSTDGLRYRQAGEEEGYEFAGWYRVMEDGSLVPYNFESLVTGNLTIRAIWRQKGSFRVFYSTEKALDRNGNEIEGLDAGSFKEAPEAPEDDFRYAENATVVVRSGSVELEEAGYRFIGWYFNNRVLSAGDVFTADPLLAEKQPGMETEDAAYDTFILYPVFAKAEEEEPAGEEMITRLILDANGGSYTEGYPLPEEAALNSDGSRILLAYTNLPVNGTVDLPAAKDGNDIFTRENAEFLGWAFSREAKTPVFKAGRKVGLDNLEGAGYNGDQSNVLYAVWRQKEVTLRIRNVDGYSASTPLSGSAFTFVNGSTEMKLQAGSDGYLRNSDNQELIRVATPVSGREVLTYTMDQTRAPAGYQKLNGNIQISVDYDGNVFFCQEGGEWQEAGFDGSSYRIVVRNIRMPAPTAVVSNDKPYGFMVLAGFVLASLMILSARLRKKGKEA